MSLFEIQSLVARVQAILSAEADPSPSVLQRVSSEFQLAVDAVNVRLRECESYLHRGHRSEALQLVDVEPNLLEAVAALDFPELPAWIDYLSQFQIAAPAVPLVDVAAEINDAFVAGQPIEHLLRKQRLHALARSDLKTRSQILRELCRADAGNPLWTADLAAFEKQRIEDVRIEFEAAARKRQLDRIAVLDDELTTTRWSVEPPRRLQQRVRGEHDKLRRDQAREELNDVAHKLSDAFGALDLPRGRRHRERWNALLTIAELPSDDPLFELAGPALDWLDEACQREQQESDFQSSLQELTSSLDREIDVTELDKLVSQASRFGRELPNVLLARVAERKRLLEVQARRRFWMVAGGSVVSVVLLLGLTAFLFQRQSFALEVAKHATQLNTLIDGGNLTDARKYLDSLGQTAPLFCQTPELSGLAAALGEAERDEAARAAEVQQLIAHARTIAIDNPRWENFDAAYEDLRKAGEIAVAAEKASILRTRGDVDREKGLLQAEVDDQFLADKKEVEQEIANVSKEDVEEYTGLLERLKELQNRPYVSAVHRSVIAALIEKCNVERGAVMNDLAVARRLARVSATIGNRSNYIRELREYAREQAGTKRSNNFLQVAESEGRLWDAVEGWRAVRGKFKAADLKATTPERAESLLAELEKLQNDSPYPGEMGLDERVAALRAIAGRKFPMDKGVANEFRELLDAAELNDLLAVDVFGKRYYTNELPEEKGKELHLRVFTELDLSNKTLVKVRLNGVKDFAQKVSRRDWLSAQSRFRNEALRLLNEPTAAWEECLGQIAQTLAAEGDMDPILKVQLLGRLLDFASRGSVFLAKSLETSIESLNRDRLPVSANWIAADDPNVDALRSKARAQLRIVSGETLKKAFDGALELRRKAQTGRIGPSLKWVGWVWLRDGKWHLDVSPTPSPPGSGELMVVHAGVEDSSKPMMTKVGESTSKGPVVLEAAFQSTDASICVEGRPLYLAVND